ncbi:hypothetical protein DPMN_088285 [Dreissena polymorpha]|uniref:Uncharacterized protein n=1 Tax=Dreissena polymorpha TaxID=45954 RepID=A0A9D4KTT9_DREPO|nr:hypothetical protein DPMN_088285 [Dreissena polymorpha]
MLHRALDDLLTPIMKIEEYMQKHAMMRLRREGLHLSKHVLSTESPFYHNPIGFAMKRYAFSECFKCKKVSSSL